MLQGWIARSRRKGEPPNDIEYSGERKRVRCGELSDHESSSLDRKCALGEGLKAVDGMAPWPAKA